MATTTAALKSMPDHPGRLIAGGLVVALFAALVAGVVLGAYTIPFADILRLILAPTSELATQQYVIVELRLPRVLMAATVGGALAVAGAAAQGLFRNPLAEPALIGVAMGAVAGGVLWIVFAGHLFGAMEGMSYFVFLPAAAMAAGLATAVIVFKMATHGRNTDVATLLLAGIALNALAAAITGLCVFASDDQALRDLSFWTLGSFSGASFRVLGIVLALSAVPAGLIFASRGVLNALALGESEAFYLGVDVERAKRRLLVSIAILTSVSVAFCGVIAFVGLVAPHLVRLMLGPDHRVLLPSAAVLGATLLTVADLIARTIVVPAELPVGIVTSLVGAPFFMWLLSRRRLKGLH